MIYLLGYLESKQNEGKFDYSISVNDFNKNNVFRTYGNIATLELNFDDVWYGDDGKLKHWVGNVAQDYPYEEDKLPTQEVLEQVKKFVSDNPDFLEKESLIHCWAGVSRSTSILLYLLLLNGFTIQDAVERIISVRSIARPNLTLVKLIDQELKLDNKLVEYIKSRLNYEVIN